MTHHRIPHPTSLPGRAVAEATPPPRVLDPHRRTLFAQRLAVLIQRLRAVSTERAKEDRPHDT
jgi:hypothetical protein